MSTETERRCARRRERRKFSPVIPSVLRSLRSTSRPAFRRRRRTARRCNVHFYGRPNQAAAPVTHRRPIASRGTVLCYSSPPFLSPPPLLLSLSLFLLLIPFPFFFLKLQLMFWTKALKFSPTRPDSSHSFSLFLFFLFSCFLYLISNANGRHGDSRLCSSEFHYRDTRPTRRARRIHRAPPRRVLA